MKESECYSGKKIGRLTLISRQRVLTKSFGWRWEWLCQCDCGRYRKVYTFRLGWQNRHGKRVASVIDCGNHTHEKLVANGHKGTKSPDEASDATPKSPFRRLYCKWVDMNKRCYNPNTNNYANYGGRGIAVCDEWREYEPFKQWALEQGYDPTNKNRNEQTIDRIDVNGNYEPSNCRFVDNRVQSNNKRNNVKFELSFDDLADLTGCDITYLRNQYYHNDKYIHDNKLYISDMLKKKEVG